MEEAFSQLDDNKKADYEIGEKDCWTGEYYISLECARGAVKTAVAEEREWTMISKEFPEEGQQIIGELSFCGCSEFYIGTIQNNDLKVSNPCKEGYVLIDIKQLRRWRPFKI